MKADETLRDGKKTDNVCTLTWRRVRVTVIASKSQQYVPLLLFSYM